MTTPWQQINAKVAKVDHQCLANKMDKHGCSVGLDEAPTPFMVIDLDHAMAPVKTSAVKCHYLFFAQRPSAGLWAVPLELKSSAVNPNRALSQLQAGAATAEQLTKGLSPVVFVPVVAQGRKTRRRQYQELRKKRVVFRSEEHPIELMDCGTDLQVDIGE